MNELVSDCFIVVLLEFFNFFRFYFYFLFYFLSVTEVEISASARCSSPLQWSYEAKNSPCVRPLSKVTENASLVFSDFLHGVRL